MKSLLGKLGVILIGLTIFGSVEVWGNDWKFYGEGRIARYYYDSESITRPSQNTVRVWVKLSYNEEGLLEMVKEHGEKYRELSYGLVSSEIDCSNKRYRILLEIFCTKEAGILSSSTIGKLSERDIPPESMVESLSKAVCK